MKMEINIICTGEAVGAKVEAIASKPRTLWLLLELGLLLRRRTGFNDH
jgi:hypothetical protein